MRLRLSGELDFAAAPQMSKRLNDAFARAQVVVVDLRQLTFMDCAGVRMLVAGHDHGQRGGRRLSVIRGPRQVDRLFELTGAQAHLDLVGVADECPAQNF